MTNDSRMKRCDAATRAGRLAKAEEFWSASETLSALADDDGAFADAIITLCVHAGVAAADVICCARLGVHARGQSHDEAAALLGKADKPAAKHLRVLLGMKTKSGYSDRSSRADERRRAQRAAEALVDAAKAF